MSSVALTGAHNSGLATELQDAVFQAVYDDKADEVYSRSRVLFWTSQPKLTTLKLKFHPPNLPPLS